MSVRLPAVLRVARALLGMCVLVGPGLLVGQQTASPPSTSADLGCRHPADPHRRRHYCNDAVFGLDETLAGGWNQVRRAAMHLGLTPTASYIGALQTNVTGGPHQVWPYAGLLSFAVSADLKELSGIKGLSVYVGASWGTGGNLSASLGSAIPTSGLYAPLFYLGEMYLQQNFAGRKITILAGRLSAANSFASLPVFANYITYGINPNPYSLGANDVTFFGPPTGTEWAVQGAWDMTPSIQVSAGAFNTNVPSANGENHGADFTLQEGNKGVLAIGEIDYLRNQRDKSVGKPGQFTLGALHNSNSFPHLINPLNVTQGYTGVYLMGQQMIFRPDGPQTTRGASVWGAWSHNSKDTVSQFPQFWGAGLSYQALFPARKNDTLSFALIRAQSSKYVVPSATEQFLELNYQWLHSRYLAVSPHGQYLWKAPGNSTRNATILGIQVAITL
ncbi:MAG: carbohydrate porin [Acidobacteriaceae bacterium]